MTWVWPISVLEPQTTEIMLAARTLAGTASLSGRTQVGATDAGVWTAKYTGFFVYGAQGPLWAICPDLVGREHSGTAVGIMDALAYGGAAAQGPLLGYIVSRQDAGYSALFLTLAIVTAAGAVLAVVNARPASAR